jgi:hypothetical protein
MRRRDLRRTRLVVVACMAALALLVAAPVAQADDTVCGIAGNPAIIVVLTGGPYDNVVVPEGGRCYIQFAVIRGNVKALPDSLLTLVGNEIGGNIIGDKADMVQVQQNTIGGDVHIKEGGPNTVEAAEVLVGSNTLTSGDIVVQKMTIVKGLLVGFTGENYVQNGNVTVEDNVILGGTSMSVDSQQIANGNLHVFKNTGPGAKSVMKNNVSPNGDIQCYENEDPFVGGPNQGRAPKSVIVPSFPPVFPPTTAPNQCSGTSM